ncbi:helix-turn-helix domain-containing protein [bacterium]|nr:helix-turn-helix domain-containing protein [bacterium]
MLSKIVIMEIGKKIKILRVKNGLNQQQLADLINKTRTLISHIEVTSKVNYYTLNEIAKVFGVDVTYFTEKDNNELKEDAPAYSKAEDKIEKLEREVELLTQIVDNQKELIKQLKENRSAKS